MYHISAQCHACTVKSRTDSDMTPRKFLDYVGKDAKKVEIWTIFDRVINETVEEFLTIHQLLLFAGWYPNWATQSQAPYWVTPIAVNITQKAIHDVTSPCVTWTSSLCLINIQSKDKTSPGADYEAMTTCHRIIDSIESLEKADQDHIHCLCFSESILKISLFITASCLFHVLRILHQLTHIIHADEHRMGSCVK